jgi:hypothetical protein
MRQHFDHDASLVPQIRVVSSLVLDITPVANTKRMEMADMLIKRLGTPSKARSERCLLGSPGLPPCGADVGIPEFFQTVHEGQGVAYVSAEDYLR